MFGRMDTEKINEAESGAVGRLPFLKGRILMTKDNRKNIGNSGNKNSKTEEIMEKLEQGITELFESENYKNYLRMMCKFHNYSFQNSLLIAMQKPDASYVAGYHDWQKKFKRQVMKGEKGITILAPSPYKKQSEREAIDPITNRPIIGPDGQPLKDIIEIIIPSYRTVTVFDISQTEGEPLPTIGVDELQGNVQNYEKLVKILEGISPVPICRQEIEGSAKGYFSPAEQRIVLQEGLPEMQEVKTLIHEITHSILHNKSAIQMTKEEEKLVALLDEVIPTEFGYIPVMDYLTLCASASGFKSYFDAYERGVRVEKYEAITPDIVSLYEKKKILESNRNTKEVQAESIAYAVCNYFGIPSITIFVCGSGDRQSSGQTFRESSI